MENSLISPLPLNAEFLAHQDTRMVSSICTISHKYLQSFVLVAVAHPPPHPHPRLFAVDSLRKVPAFVQMEKTPLQIPS